MFDYENMRQDQIDILENSEGRDLFHAILLIVHGHREGILTLPETLQQIHNIALAGTEIL